MVPGIPFNELSAGNIDDTNGEIKVVITTMLLNPYPFNVENMVSS
jgi:hypothetical protein